MYIPNNSTSNEICKAEKAEERTCVRRVTERDQEQGRLLLSQFHFLFLGGAVPAQVHER